MRHLPATLQTALTAALYLLAVITLTVLANNAFAHTGGDQGQHHGLLPSFLQGFTHPFTGLDHLAAMVGVGLWTAVVALQLDRRLMLAPFTFALTLGLGAVLGFMGISWVAVEPMIATSVLLVGLLAAIQLSLPSLVTASLVAVFAIFHGVAHGVELATQESGLLVLLGMVLATLLLHGAGMAVGVLMRQQNVWWPRLMGAGIAAFGASLLFV